MRFTPELKEDLRRWISYGWEWRIIHKLLLRKHGVDVPKNILLWLIKKHKK